MLHDGLANRAGIPHQRLQVHDQARAGVHFDHGAVLRFQRLANVVGDQIDSRHVQPHGLRRDHAAGGDVRVHAFRDVDREIAVVVDDDGAASGRHRGLVEALVAQELE
jgi:integrase